MTYLRRRTVLYTCLGRLNLRFGFLKFSANWAKHTIGMGGKQKNGFTKYFLKDPQIEYVGTRITAYSQARRMLSDIIVRAGRFVWVRHMHVGNVSGQTNSQVPQHIATMVFYISTYTSTSRSRDCIAQTSSTLFLLETHSASRDIADMAGQGALLVRPLMHNSYIPSNLWLAKFEIIELPSPGGAVRYRI